MRNSNHNLPHLIAYRKHLRTYGTHAEAVLWLSLKKRQLEGRRFRRQYSVGPYILDFFCPSEKLAVEVDGPYHNEPQQVIRDEKRTRYLEEQGIRVVRVENEAVFEDLEAVLAYIAGFFGSDPSALRAPPPGGEDAL